MPCQVYHEVPSLKLTTSLHLFKWMVGPQAFPIGVSALFFRGKLLVYQRLMVSKVVSTHRTGPHPEQPLPTGPCSWIPFIVVERGIVCGWLDPFKATDLRCRLKRQSVAKVMLI